MMPLEKFYTDDPRWHATIGDIHALLERVKISEERSVPVSAPVNVPVNAVSDKILILLRANPQATAQKLAQAIGVSDKTIKRHLKTLREQGRLVRVGSDKAGHWEVV